MSDHRQREIERLAAQGDPLAAERLLAERLRVGDPYATLVAAARDTLSPDTTAGKVERLIHHYDVLGDDAICIFPLITTETGLPDVVREMRKLRNSNLFKRLVELTVDAEDALCAAENKLRLSELSVRVAATLELPLDVVNYELENSRRDVADTKHRLELARRQAAANAEAAANTARVGLRRRRTK